MKSVLSLFGLLPRRIGGIESFAYELSAQLQNLGWRSVLVFTGPPTPEVERYLSLPNVSLEVAPELAGLGPRAVSACAVLLRRYRPEIFHFSFLSPISPFPWLARLHGSRKVFFTDQHSRTDQELRRSVPALKKLAGRLVTLPITACLCASRLNRESMKASGYFSAGRIHLFYNSIPLPPLDGLEESRRGFRRRHGIPLDRELVVQVSSIVPEKGVDVVLEAARLVLQQRPAAHFAFAGDGSHLSRYQDLARSMGIDSSVTWLGLIANPMTAGLYAAADVVCLASRWQEAFGLVLIEGMAFQRPAVAAAVGGIPEIVEDGRTGYLVPREDPEALARRLLELLADPELRRRMGVRAREVVQAKFELSAQVGRLLRIHYGLG